MVDVEGGRGGGGGRRGKACGQTSRPQRTGWAPRKGEGRANHHGRSVAGQSPLYSSIPPRIPREVGGGGSAGGEPPDCVKSLRAAVALTLAPTFSALSSLFWDVLRLLQSGLVCVVTVYNGYNYMCALPRIGVTLRHVDKVPRGRALV